MPHAFPITQSRSSNDNAERAIVSAPNNYIARFERVVFLDTPHRVTLAVSMARKLLPGWAVILVQKTRSREQNDKFWAMLTDLSRCKPLGLSYTPEIWKAVMMRACGHEIRYIIGIDGEPFPYGYRSSKLKVGQMSELIAYTDAFGTNNGVKWSDPEYGQRIDMRSAAPCPKLTLRGRYQLNEINDR